jgi:1-acyl-sn-glycerol-3-phosphate acyltransferase
MLYYILRPYVRIILLFFAKRITINGIENIPKSGAVLLASTHPNSFFDAIFLCVRLNRRIWSLARGDAFRKNWVKKILASLFMMPIHRISEGKENLGENDETFKKCYELFQKGEMVLIFSEGLCTNQKELLPLRKGTGRLVQKAWGDGLDLKVLPVGLMYNHFDDFGKKINCNIAKPIQKSDFEEVTQDGFFLKTFNSRLESTLKSLISHQFKAGSSIFYSMMYVLNFPIYFLSQCISKKFTKGTVFFDSITFASMIFLLPVYWLILGIIIKIFI